MKQASKSAFRGSRFHLVAAALSALLALLPPAVKAQSIADQVLHYKLDEGVGATAFDSSGNGHDATLINDPVWIPGQSGTALSFDGATSYAVSGFATDLAAWTVAVWTRSPAAPSTARSNGPVQREKNFAIGWDHPEPTFRGAAALRVAGIWYAASFGALAGNTWYHLAATYDGETLKTYKDGVLVGTNTAPSGPPDAESAPLMLGKNATAPQYFQGDVDDVQVFSRALTEAEVQSLAITAPDSTPPQISSVSVTASTGSATITWTTDEPSDSEVNYGTTTALGLNATDATLATSHSAMLTGLDPSTQYFFEVTSQDPSGNLAVDDNAGSFYTFTTLAPGTTGPAEVHYKLDEGVGSTAFDSSGNGRNATLVNNPAWIPGQVGTALSFDGVSSYAQSGFATNLPQWTVAVWTRSPSAPGTGSPSGPIQREKNFAIGWNHPDPTFRGAAALRVAGIWYAASFGTLAGNTWYHLAATYDGETLKTYKDGVLVGTNTAPSGPPDAESAPLTLGKNATLPQYFQGDVDDVQVFASALTEAEIVNLIVSAPDFTPPQISNVSVTASTGSATITWTTDEPSDSEVNYGTTAALGLSASDAALATSHSVTLTGLNPSTQYFFEVTSRDPSGNLGVDDNAGSLYTFTTLAPGAVGPAELYYSLDEGVGAVAFDSSGNGWDATLINGPVWIPGQSGTALSFDGVSSYAQSGFATNLPQWTVAVWTRSPSAPGTGSPSGPIQREKNFAIGWDHPDPTFRGAAALRVAGIWYAASFGTLAGNTWYHLAATYDGETLTAYKDGVLVGTNTAPSGPPDPEPAPLTLGKNATVPQYFQGDVDDVQVFGEVLTEAQIVELMAVEPDVTPPQIAGVSVTPSATSALITWTTDEPSDSEVNYGTTAALGLNVADAAPVANHSVTVTGLNPSTQYFFEVTSQDPSGNLAVDDNAGALYAFMTSAVPPAPVIGNVQIASVTDTTATITWSTDLLADSTVEYGTDASLGLSVSDPSDVTSHSVTLTSLQQGATYFFKVSSTGEGGTAEDDNGGLLYSFTTTDDVVFSNIVVTDITATSATVRWETNVPTHASVERNIVPSFGCPLVTLNPQSDPHYCTVWNQFPKTNPEVRLAELSPNTTYHFQVRAALSDGGEVYSVVTPFTFTTSGLVGAPVDAQISANSDDAHSDPFAYDETAFEVPAGVPATIPVTGGWRWTGLGIPAGAIITEAWVELNQKDLGTGFVSLLALEDSPSPTTFSPGSAPHARWAVRTSFEIEWPWPHTDQPGTWIRTSSLVAGVQELVDSYGAIDAIVLLEQGVDEPFHSHLWSSYDLSPSLGARLHIQYIDPEDLTPPQISNVVVSTSATAATVSWTTDEPSDSVVDYGPDSGLGLTVSESNFETSHSVTLTGLTPSTEYVFEVTSADSNGNQVTDDNGGLLYSFTTLESPTFGGDLVLHYQLDEGAGTVAFDSSATGQDATLVNGPVWVTGQVGASALSFDGVGSYVETGFATDLPEWTVAVWVNSPSSPDATASNGPIQREDNFAIGWDHPDSAFRGAAALSVGGNWYSASFGNLAPNTWYHLAATYDGVTLKAYRDGILVDVNEDPSGPPDSEAVTLKIGRNASQPQFFEGEVDDVQMFDRALAEFEIFELSSQP